MGHRPGEFFIRVLVTLPVQLSHVLAAAAKNPRSWIAAVLDNLDRLARVSDKLEIHRGASIAGWIGLIRVDPPSFQKVVRKLLVLDDVN